MELRYTTNARFLLLAMLGSIFASSAYLIFIYDPLSAITAKIISFHPDSIAFKLWKQPPYDIFINVYIFNVTNSEEFLNGEEKLRFNQIGPYVYREISYMTHINFNQNGSVTFQPHRLLKFMPELSVGDATVDTLLSPNIPLLGITGSLQDSSSFLNFLVSVASVQTGAQPFLNLTVNEYLFGYDDPLVTLANNIVPNWIDFPRFGIMDRMMALDNGSSTVTMTLNPPTKPSDIKQFSIEKWNGSPGLSQWGYQSSDKNTSTGEESKCGLVEDTFMCQLFPSNIERNATFRLYRHAFCRPLLVHHVGDRLNRDGFQGYYYKSVPKFFARPEENADSACYCTKDNCLPTGLGDLSPCYYGIPIAMSQPHFLNADPMLLNQVDGLSPDSEKHGFSMLLHPKLGVPLELKFRLQINLYMPETKYNSKTKPFNNLILPLFWLELSVDSIPNQIKFYINTLYHVLPTVQNVIMYIFTVLGVTLISGSATAAVLHLLKGRNQNHSGRKVNYSEIPVFPLKTKLLKPEATVLIDK